MSRAKDPSIIKESQKVFKYIKIIGIIIAIILICTLIYSVATKRDTDVVNIDAIFKEQMEKVLKRDLTPYQKRIERLKDISNSRILDEAEIEELNFLLTKTDEIKKGLRIKYALPNDTERKECDELKFNLKVNEEIETVQTGPGTHHRLWANKPYKAVSVEADGRKTYNMPAGWGAWIGIDPWSPLMLIGKEKGTIVRIWPQK